MPPIRRKKRSVFLVDTKTTCFLCLEEIVSKNDPLSPPLQPVIKMECVEDLGVLNDVISSAEGEKEEEQIQKTFSLRAICKLLKIDEEKLLWSKIPAHSLSSKKRDFQNLSDLVVTLCDRCHNVSSHLSKLYMELEILQMKVDQSLCDFLDILKRSNANPDLMECFRTKFVDQLDHQLSSVVEGVREEVMKKCFQHLKSSTPKVLTSFTPRAPPPSVMAEMISNIPHFRTQRNKLLCTICPPNSGEFSYELSLKRHYFQFHPDYFFRPMKNPSLSEDQFQKLCLQLMETEISASDQTIQGDSNLLKSDVTFICQYCSKSYFGSGNYSFNLHLIQTHNQILTSKLADLQKNSSHFKTTDLPSSPKFECQYCQLKFSMKFKLIRHQIGSIRCRPTAPSKEPKSQTNVKTKARIRCPDCGKGFIHSVSLNRHKEFHCPQLKSSKDKKVDKIPTPTGSMPTNLFESLPLIPKTEDNLPLCSLCPADSAYEFSTDKDFKDHLFLAHPYHFFGAVKDPQCTPERFRHLLDVLLETEISEIDAGGNVRFGCKQCTSSFQDNNSLRVHLVQDHHELIALKLKNQQRNGTSPSSALENSERSKKKSESQQWKCPDCDMLFSFESIMTRHRELFCKVKKASKVNKTGVAGGDHGTYLKCPSCEAIFDNSSNLERHNVERCRFRQMRGCVFSPSRDATRSKRASSPIVFSCEYCGNTFSSSWILEKHQLGYCPDAAKGAAIQQQSEQSQPIVAEAFGTMEEELKVEVIEIGAEVGLETEEEVMEIREGNAIDTGQEEVIEMEEDENEMNQESFSSTKIVVVDTPQVQISSHSDDQENEVEGTNDDLFLASHIW